MALSNNRAYWVLFDGEDFIDMSKKPWLSVFTRVNNRKKRFRPDDLLKVGYPMVSVSQEVPWRRLHKLCEEQFIDPKGHQTYIWFGSSFFFLTNEDAEVFRGLMFMARSLGELK